VLIAVPERLVPQRPIPTEPGCNFRNCWCRLCMCKNGPVRLYRKCEVEGRSPGFAVTPHSTAGAMNMERITHNLVALAAALGVSSLIFAVTLV